MKILLLAGLIAASQACYNIPTTPNDLLVSVQIDGVAKIATKVNINAYLSDFRNCLWNVMNTTQFFFEFSSPIQQLDENHTTINQTVQTQWQYNVSNGEENLVRFVQVWTAPYLQLVVNGSDTQWVNVFDSFSLSQLRQSAYLDWSIQFAYGGAPIDYSDEYSILINEVEQNGVVYTYGSSNHSNHTNDTKTEDDFENVDIAGQINITYTSLDYWGNPINSSFDLGKSWSFNNFTILVGVFDGSGNSSNYSNPSIETIYYQNLYPLGFNIIFSYDESEFLQLLVNSQVSEAHIISGNAFLNQTVYQWYWQSTLNNFVSSQGKGLLIWGNDQSWNNFHANSFFTYFYAGQNYYGQRVELRFNGTLYANSNLTPGPYRWPYTGEFFPHKVTTGINSFYEGMNISFITSNDSSYSWDQFGDFKVVANSSAEHPVILALNRTGSGRVVIDAGFSRYRNQTFLSNNSGNSRLLRNEAVYLAFNDFSTYNSSIEFSLEDFITNEVFLLEQEKGFLSSY